MRQWSASFLRTWKAGAANAGADISLTLILSGDSGEEEGSRFSLIRRQLLEGQASRTAVRPSYRALGGKGPS